MHGPARRPPRSFRSRAGRSPTECCARTSGCPDSGAGLVPRTVLAMADLDEVLTTYEDALAEAHRRGSPLALAAVKVFRAQALRWRGDLDEAEADAREALAPAETWGASARFAGHAAAFLADALMEQGKLDAAAAVLARAGWRVPPGRTRLLYLRDSGVHLRILRGDLAGGLAEMLDAGRHFESVESRNPAFIAWRSPAALALLQLGEQDEARRLAAEEVELRAAGAPRGRSAPPCAQPVWSRAASAGSLCSRKRWRSWAGPRRSLSTQRRAWSWERRCAEETAAPTPAISFDMRSSWRRSAAPRPSPHAPSVSSSPPAHVLAASP